MSTSALAVIAGSTEIDFDRFQHEIDACAQWLTESLTPDEQRIIVYIRSKYWHWVVTLALLQMGRSSVSVYSLKLVPKDTRATFNAWITDRDLKVAERVVTPPFDDIRETAQAAPNNATPAQALQLKIADTARRIILTSGTTGRPKVVNLDSQQLKTRLDAASRQFGADVNGSTRLSAMMGIDTIGGMLTTLVTWLKGGALLFNTSLSDDQAADITPNLISASPLRLQLLLKNTQGIWPNQDQRIVRVGGSRLNLSVRDEALRRMGSRVQTTYGSTELGLVASCDAMVLDQYPGAAGYIYEDAKAEIVDHDDNVLPLGQRGLIRCQAAGMATGYEGETDSTVFRNGWFYSGDIGFLTEDGLLVVTGRNSDVINLGGVKISAVDLETALVPIEELKDVCVVGDHRGAPRLIVAAVYDDTVGREILKTKIREALPNKLPFLLLRVESLPRNAMGKLQRNLISKQLTDVLVAREQKNKQSTKT